MPPALLRLCLCLGAAAALSRRGEYRLAGLFPLNHPPAGIGPPPTGGCDDAALARGHGQCLSRAMRFAVEEINNSSALLPNVTLGYDIHDSCSVSANLRAVLRALTRAGGAGEYGQRGAQAGGHQVTVLRSFCQYQPHAMAVIGPDSSQLALTAAAILGVFLVPEISYEASLATLSLKRFYPSFLRTIPSDQQQVRAIFLLLRRFRWAWVALLGSDNTYGRDGLDALYKLLDASNVCVAYRGIIPADADASSSELHNLVRILVDVRVNVTVVFSSRESAQPFFEVVVQRNITGMVWVGSEDWSLAQTVWQMPGMRHIGLVIGMSLEKPEPAMLERFTSWKTDEELTAGSIPLDCTQRCASCHLLTTAFNVYSAVYAAAHGLHALLGCASGTCSKGTVYPWQLLPKIKQVNFTVYKSRISFDANGDIRKGYDIVMWNWSGPSWAFDVVGTFRVNPERLSIDQDKILWQTRDHQAPSAVCSEPCRPGERRLQQSRHRCCFSCVACPPGTFLNRSDLYGCQPCGVDEWAPARSEACLNRTVEFLSWSEPLSWALLAPTVLLLLLVAGLAVLFALNASTPVVKSAGGRMCFLMLGSLACSGSSLFCYFGEPSRPACVLRLPLFAVSLSVFLSCAATRSFQILCIFKLNARWPALHAAWLRRRGPLLSVAAAAAAQALLCLAAEAADPSAPRRDYGAGAERVVLECAASDAAARTAATAFPVLLSAGCFALSYAGKDLPSSYNEAKSLAAALLLHLACAAAVLCTQRALKGRAEAAARALGGLCTLGALLGGYFLPRAFVILLRPRLNTPEHFQMAIQRYTRRRAAAA